MTETTSSKWAITPTSRSTWLHTGWAATTRSSAASARARRDCTEATETIRSGPTFPARLRQMMERTTCTATLALTSSMGQSSQINCSATGTAPPERQQTSTDSTLREATTSPTQGSQPPRPMAPRSGAEQALTRSTAKESERTSCTESSATTRFGEVRAMTSSSGTISKQPACSTLTS